MLLGGLALGKAPIICAVLVKKVESREVNKALKAGAGMLEIRLDTFSKREMKRVPEALERLKRRGIPLLLTIRSAKEEGKGRLTDNERLALFNEFIPLVGAIDIELSSKKILKKAVTAAKSEKKKVIVSFHDFKRTPGKEKLLQIVKDARTAGADVVKIAAKVKGASELKRLAGLLTDNKDLIVIAMGATGTPSRVFFPMLGSLITYAGISGANAPGQLSISKLKSEFKFFGFK